MIEEDLEDCCDNCEEGIEPCCDEELQVEILEKIEVVDVTLDVSELAKCLCCQTQFKAIYDFMQDLSKVELEKLRDDLRSFTPKNVMHPELESRFRHAINKAN